MFTRKLAGAMERAVPAFAQLSTESRAEFLDACQGAATARGLLTEQGIAAYALAAWFLEPGFEEKSQYLVALLDSDFPEARKVHAMNEWVHVLLGEPGNLAAADEALKSAFYRTGAWGAPAGGR
jgi:hypothetical protein